MTASLCKKKCHIKKKNVNLHQKYIVHYIVLYTQYNSGQNIGHI